MTPEQQFMEELAIARTGPRWKKALAWLYVHILWKNLPGTWVRVICPMPTQLSAYVSIEVRKIMGMEP